MQTLRKQSRLSSNASLMRVQPTGSVRDRLAIRRFQQSNNPVYGQGQHRDPDDHNGQASGDQTEHVSLSATADRLVRRHASLIHRS